MSRFLRMGYRPKPHPVVYADDSESPALVPTPEHPSLPIVATAEHSRASPSGAMSEDVAHGFDLMGQFLATSLSSSTLTEYQVC